ncbi:MAG: hypothetical protein LBU64_02310 [Planctomycetota bacterium]|jgi:hypothetical protein|nr:hypothetical protein [Planctomycetota bacterium]
MGEDHLSPALRGYLDSVEQTLARAGTEPLVLAGILRDLEGQIAEMRSAEGCSDEAILSRLDPPRAYVDSPPLPSADKPPETGRGGRAEPVFCPPRLGPFSIHWWIAAVLAALAIGVEATTRICAINFFDPMPTLLQLFGLLPVPILMAYTGFRLKRGPTKAETPWFIFFNGYLCAVCLGYALAFLPLTPMAVIAVGWFGLGLLPLAPAFSLLAVIHQGCRLRQWNQSGPRRAGLWRGWLAGAVLAAGLFGGWEGWHYLVDTAIMNALDDSGQANLERLRSLRGGETLLSYCHAGVGSRYARRFQVDECRALYYRLTGSDYRETPPPKLGFSMADRGEGEGWRERFNADLEVGTNAVGSRSKNLFLKNASLDVSVAAAPDGTDAGPGVAYAELTLEFFNAGDFAREARCQIMMPPGGVASRLTLWIDGEEREAAFGKRNVAREAYRQVAVARRRDPALLTTAGPDRVLLQCFPVNPDTPMKVKVGFTIPPLPDGQKAVLAMPFLSERNFAVAAGARVTFWAESRAALEVNFPGLKAEKLSAPRLTNEGKISVQGDPAGTVHAIRGVLAPASLASVGLALPISRKGAVYRGELGGVISTRTLTGAAPLENRLVAMVLDTSLHCATLFQEGRSLDWRALLAKIPGDVRLALYAGPLSAPPMTRDEALRQWPELMRGLRFSGADEQVGNLEKAWDLCAGEANAAVLWLHGKAPFGLADASGLEQRLRRRSGDGAIGAPIIVSKQFVPGPNRIEENFAGAGGFVRLPPEDGLEPGERMARLFPNLRYPKMCAAEYRSDMRDAREATASDGSAHIARLAFARYLAEGMWRNPSGSSMAGDIETALRLRLVTPGTGAVVLESKAQYDAHDLDSEANRNTVPIIPEPEEWALMLVTAALLAFLAWRKKAEARRIAA